LIFRRNTPPLAFARRWQSGCLFSQDKILLVFFLVKGGPLSKQILNIFSEKAALTPQFMQTNTNEREQFLHSIKGSFFLRKMPLIQTLSKMLIKSGCTSASAFRKKQK
jgi:hypothetical protein